MVRGGELTVEGGEELKSPAWGGLSIPTQPQPKARTLGKHQTTM